MLLEAISGIYEVLFTYPFIFAMGTVLFKVFCFAVTVKLVLYLTRKMIDLALFLFGVRVPHVEKALIESINHIQSKPNPIPFQKFFDKLCKFEHTEDSSKVDKNTENDNFIDQMENKNQCSIYDGAK